MKDTTKVITATEFKQNLGKYIDYCLEDNEVVVTKNGKKSVRLSPYLTEIERYFTVKEKALDYQYGGKKVSYEEFIEIYEHSELRMEYINGEIVLQDSPSTFHQDIAGNLFTILKEFLGGKQCKVYIAPLDVHFFKKGLKTPDVMQPDLLITCDHQEKINSKGRYMGTPTLCIEILSQGTRSKDMVTKLNTYMLSGVREFWIVDPKKKTITIYGFKGFEVDDAEIYQHDDVVQSYYFDGLKANMLKVFEG
jgi:prevent-host-death family protein